MMIGIFTSTSLHLQAGLGWPAQGEGVDLEVGGIVMAVGTGVRVQGSPSCKPPGVIRMEAHTVVL